MANQDEILSKLESEVAMELDKSAEVIERYNTELANTLELVEKFRSKIKTNSFTSS